MRRFSRSEGRPISGTHDSRGLQAIGEHRWRFSNLPHSRYDIGAPLPECHLGGGFVLPFRQHIATLDLDRLAKFVGFLTRLRKRKQLGAAQADILPFAVTLQPKKPRGPSPLIDLQK